MFYTLPVPILRSAHRPPVTTEAKHHRPTNSVLEWYITNPDVQLEFLPSSSLIIITAPHGSLRRMSKASCLNTTETESRNGEAGRNSFHKMTGTRGSKTDCGREDNGNLITECHPRQHDEVSRVKQLKRACAITSGPKPSPAHHDLPSFFDFLPSLHSQRQLLAPLSTSPTLILRLGPVFLPSTNRLPFLANTPFAHR